MPMKALTIKLSSVNKSIMLYLVNKIKPQIC